MSQASEPERDCGHWLAVLEIRETLAEYFRALARLDPERAKRAFHPDAHEDHGPLNGNAHALIDEIFANAATAYDITVRNLIDARVDVRGERALSEANWLNIMHSGDEDTFLAGRYLDRWERRDAGWKIASRVAVVDWWRIEPRNARSFVEGAEQILRFSGRGFEDPELRAAVGLAG